MANKLPKRKNNNAENEVEVVKPATENESAEIENTEQNGDAALNNVLNAAATAAQSAADSADNDGEHEDTAEDESAAPDVQKDNESDENEAEQNKPEAKSDKPDDGITVAAPTKTPTKPTMVDVITNADHTCSIGGKRYEFKRGKKTSVPRPVKDILRNAGLLMPL